MTAIQEKIVIDGPGEPQGAIIPWAQFCELNEAPGLDLDAPEQAELREAIEDSRARRDEAFTRLRRQAARVFDQGLRRGCGGRTLHLRQRKGGPAGAGGFVVKIVSAKYLQLARETRGSGTCLERRDQRVLLRRAFAGPSTSRKGERFVQAGAELVV